MRALQAPLTRRRQGLTTITIKVIDFGNDGGKRESRRLADLPDRVVEGDPHHRSTNYFENEVGDVIAGTWTSTPGRWHADETRVRP